MVRCRSLWQNISFPKLNTRVRFPVIGSPALTPDTVARQCRPDLLPAGCTVRARIRLADLGLRVAELLLNDEAIAVPRR